MTNDKFDIKLPMNRRNFGRAALGMASSLIMARAAMAETIGVDVASLDTPQAEWEEPFDPNLGRTLFGAPGTDYATLAPTTLQSSQNAIDRYAEIAANGGWASVPDDVALRLGVRHENVILLRRRLMVTGDLESTEGRANVFDSFVEMGVRHFQYRHGLYPNGLVNEATLAALNVSALDRLQQLRVNIVRLRSLAEDIPEKYVMVNIPGQEVEAIENSIAYSRHVAIVGRPERQTPIIIAKIHELNFSPYWHVPRSIIERDLIPQVQTDPEYLARYQIRIYDNNLDEIAPETIDWYSDEPLKYSFRQDPGEDLNAMGAVKINFYNSHAVFLHDTPEKDLFAENYRAYSSGCVRVQNVEHLITWLLSANQKEEWSRSKVDAVIRSGERIDAPLEARVPIYLSYITAWSQPDGKVQFRRDLYERDGVDQLAGSY